MGYLHFDKRVLGNLEQSVQLEYLISGRCGAYSSSSVVGCNTRKFHGEFVVPSGIEGKANLVLVSSLDEAVVSYGNEYCLGVHNYDGMHFIPQGHEHMRGFEINQSVAMLYAAGGVWLEKSKVVCDESNLLIVRYRIVDGVSDAVLRLTPLFAFRGSAEMCVENDEANTKTKKVSGGFSACLYKGYPTVYVQTSGKEKFEAKVAWNKGIQYYLERDRGYHDREDLVSLGAMDITLRKGEDVYVGVGLSEVDCKKLKEMYDAKVASAREVNSLRSALLHTADQHYTEVDGKLLIRSGYPWHEIEARDMAMSMVGFNLPSGNTAQYEQCAESILGELEAYVHSLTAKASAKKIVEFKSVLHGIEQPDVIMWVVWSMQEYAKKVGKDAFKKKYGDRIKKLLLFIIEGKHPKIEVSYNGLLYIKGWEEPQTWMNARLANGRPVTPRSGWVVEINALWYDALMFAQSYLGGEKDKEAIAKIEATAEKVSDSFVSVFWNGNYLFDFVDGNHREMALRPNMLWAVALGNSLLDSGQKKSVVDLVTRELLTPKGIRTLTPKGENFRGMCAGGEWAREYARHHGSVYPWLSGVYCEAYMRVYKNGGASFLRELLRGLEGDIFTDTVGGYAETYDGWQSFKAREGIMTAVNVAGVLRAEEIVNGEKEK